jgi:hypothetical protein
MQAHIPPPPASLSNISTLYPFCARTMAAPSPAGPAPITANFFPFSGALWNLGMTPIARDFAMMVAWTAGMFTGESNRSWTQAFMQCQSGQTIPQIPPRGFWLRMSAADLLISEGLPTLAAMMKSKGEQSQGHATVQGFSAQYSHFSISLLSCASVSMGFVGSVFIAVKHAFFFLIISPSI